jgi:hypothetical protein
LHDTTSRYDAAARILTFLLVCRTCGIERVAETLEYEPRPVWTSPATTAGQPYALPVESDIPREMASAERPYRKLAA